MSWCRWLEEVEQKYQEDVYLDSSLSWAAYHANQQPEQNSPSTFTAIAIVFLTIPRVLQ